ncbi:MAG: hypothetical protein Kilf2KO_27950 [Rhodospirillales bacterium]
MLGHKCLFDRLSLEEAAVQPVLARPGHRAGDPVGTCGDSPQVFGRQAKVASVKRSGGYHLISERA